MKISATKKIKRVLYRIAAAIIKLAIIWAIGATFAHLYYWASTPRGFML